VDTEERSSVEAQQDKGNEAAPVHHETEEEENKFQKAIGAWRSKATGRIHLQKNTMLTLRQTSTSPPSFRSSTQLLLTLSHTRGTRSHKGRTSPKRPRTSGSSTMPASSATSRRS
jgi:hypothetical protein